MRGKRFEARAGDLRNRITPADAGKTFILRVYPLKTQDHPRRCGENLLLHLRLRLLLGSPPQVRGKRCADVVNLGSTGITPAGAGKTAQAG